MTQFEVMINLAGIKTKEGEDFVRVIKKVQMPGDFNRMSKCDIYLENGSICFVNTTNIIFSTGMSLNMFCNKYYDFNQTGMDTFWSEFRRVMIEIAGLYEF